MSPVPPRFTRVLAHTSVYMLVPVILSPEPLFTLCMFLNFVFSVLHWSFYRDGSVYQTLDRFFSVATISFLTYFSSTLTPLPFLLSFFLAGHHYRRRDEFDYHLPLHLTFRAIAFWWCCHFCDHVDMDTFALYLIAYAAQIYFGLHQPTHADISVKDQKHQD